jgi:hypothetical protein
MVDFFFTFLKLQSMDGITGDKRGNMEMVIHM